MVSVWQWRSRHSLRHQVGYLDSVEEFLVDETLLGGLGLRRPSHMNGRSALRCKVTITIVASIANFASVCSWPVTNTILIARRGPALEGKFIHGGYLVTRGSSLLPGRLVPSALSVLGFGECAHANCERARK